MCKSHAIYLKLHSVDLPVTQGFPICTECCCLGKNHVCFFPLWSEKSSPLHSWRIFSCRWYCICFLVWILYSQSVVQSFCHSVVSDSLQPHGLQHIRLPYPLLTSRVCSNSCPLSQWGYPTILSSIVIPFSSCFQYLPTWPYFPVSQFFASRTVQ